MLLVSMTGEEQNGNLGKLMQLDVRRKGSKEERCTEKEFPKPVEGPD